MSLWEAAPAPATLSPAREARRRSPRGQSLQARRRAAAAPRLEAQQQSQRKALVVLERVPQRPQAGAGRLDRERDRARRSHELAAAREHDVGRTAPAAEPEEGPLALRVAGGEH